MAHDDFLNAFLMELILAEEEEDSEDVDESADDDAAADTGQDGSDADAEDGDEDEKPKERTYPKAYVTRLKNEAKRAREELAELKAASDDKDKVKESKGAADKALTAQLRAQAMEHAVAMEAAKLSFADPEDAFALLDVSDIDVDDKTGKPEREDVIFALKALVKSKPYLLKGKATAAGKGDGGAKGGAPKPQSTDAKVAEQVKAYQGRGMVLVP